MKNAMKKRLCSRQGIIAAVFALGLVASAFHAARANLMITPLRVVFGARDRSAVVQLINTTDKANTYRMSWRTMKMDKDGRYVDQILDNDPHSVAKMITFSPRQVRIQPGESQILRLFLRRPADLPDGEYRAHLVFMQVSDGAAPSVAQKEKGVDIGLNVNLGFSIPVIVRQGQDNNLKVSLSDFKLVTEGTPDKPTPALQMVVKRDSGKFSSYGGLRVFWKKPGKDEQQIGMISNLALFPETDHRLFSVPLTESPTSGKLRVVYEGKYESEGKIWDQKEFPVTQ